MNGFLVKTRRDKKLLTVTIIVVFLAGWFLFSYYIYSNQILVIPIEGEIVGFQPIAFELQQAKTDSNVKAVILDLNTPGGGAYASMEIANNVANLKKTKPVVAVMEDECASGGYYIASFADYIITHSNTLTGSIGVIAVWTDLSEYYKNQGINITVWKTGSEKDLGADWRPPTKEESVEINATVYSIFQTLLTDITQNRHLSQSAVDTVKTGATFSGTHAVELGLANKVGSIIDAVIWSLERTGMIRFLIITPDMDEKQRFFSALF